MMSFLKHYIKHIITTIWWDKIRQTYDGFKEKELNYTSPFEICYDWFEEADTEEINDPDAMALATVNDDGPPTVRMVLLKKVDQS